MATGRSASKKGSAGTRRTAHTGDRRLHPTTKGGHTGQYGDRSPSSTIVVMSKPSPATFARPSPRDHRGDQSQVTGSGGLVGGPSDQDQDGGVNAVGERGGVPGPCSASAGCGREAAPVPCWRPRRGDGVDPTRRFRLRAGEAAAERRADVDGEKPGLTLAPVGQLALASAACGRGQLSPSSVARSRNRSQMHHHP